MPKVFTNGCFDVLHIGHIRLLDYCKRLAIDGDVIVGLNSDASVQRLKGKHRPYVPQEIRAEMLKALRSVDHVEIFDADDPYDLIKEIKPHIIVKGGDYRPDEVVGADLCRVEIFEYVPGYSTTKILEDFIDR